MADVLVELKSSTTQVYNKSIVGDENISMEALRLSTGPLLLIQVYYLEGFT